MRAAAGRHLKQNRLPPTSAVWALANSHDHSALRVANHGSDPDADNRGGLCRHAVCLSVCLAVCSVPDQARLGH
jgi:hypothetical protein